MLSTNKTNKKQRAFIDYQMILSFTRHVDTFASLYCIIHCCLPNLSFIIYHLLSYIYFDLSFIMSSPSQTLACSYNFFTSQASSSFHRLRSTRYCHSSLFYKSITCSVTSSFVSCQQYHPSLFKLKCKVFSTERSNCCRTSKFCVFHNAIQKLTTVFYTIPLSFFWARGHNLHRTTSSMSYLLAPSCCRIFSALLY